METYTEVLAAGKSNKHVVMRWAPTGPASGVLTIDTDRHRVTYVVNEFACQFDGRAFHLLKSAAGSDPEAESYDVFCARNGQDHICTCRGFGRHGRCKHHAACEAIIDNGWMRHDLVNPDQDVSNTEPPF